MRYVVSVWNKIGNWRKFESEVPLLFNARRKKRLGIRHPTDLLILSGYDTFDPEYLSLLDDAGYIIHDVGKEATRYREKLSNLVSAYESWYRIQYYGLIRFLIIGDMFRGEHVFAADSDIIGNATFDDLARSSEGKTFQTAQSSCFISINDDKWHDDYRTHLFAMNDDPHEFVRRHFAYEKPETYLDPKVAGGTDQAFLGHLARAGMIRDDVFPFYTQHCDLVWFPNWMHVGVAADALPWRYTRRNGVDYMNDKKVAFSHMSNDTCFHFGFFVMLRHVLGLQDVGRLPVPYHGMDDAHADPRLKAMYSYVRTELEIQRNKTADVASLNHDPMLRQHVLAYFYEMNDFSQIFNGRRWWQPGVFA